MMEEALQAPGNCGPGIRVGAARVVQHLDRWDGEQPADPRFDAARSFNEGFRSCGHAMINWAAAFPTKICICLTDLLIPRL